MGTDMRVHVLQLLRSYQDRERKIAILHYELTHHVNASTDKLLNCMDFGRITDSTSSPNHVTDNTPHTALSYQELADCLNSAVVNKIIAELTNLEEEQYRLCYYVSRLERRQAVVVRFAFFDGLSWDQIAAELHVVRRTAHKIKEQALENLVWMYQYMDGVKGNNMSMEL